jgi:hypothetical protein
METEISKMLAFHSTLTQLIAQDFSTFNSNENVKFYKKYCLPDKLMTNDAAVLNVCIIFFYSTAEGILWILQNSRL